MININNTDIEVYKTSDFLKLDIEKPEIQRILEHNKVRDIIDYQLNFNKKYGRFNFNVSGLINLHKLDKKLFLVDGQHRFKALEKLYNNYSHDVSFFVEIVRVDSLEELKENYSMINKNTPLPEFSYFSLEDKGIVEEGVCKFQENYEQVWSKGNNRSRRPYINFNFFQEALAYVVENTNIDTSKELIKVIEDYNNKLSGWDNTCFPKTNAPMYNKAKEFKFFLGLYPTIDEDYRYEWARKIVEQLTGKAIKKKSYKKKKIPKKIKIDCWKKYIGSKVGETLCICCKNSNINQNDFVAGHIISEKNGGKITVENILPICNQCNLSMSSMNMDEFILQYYPKNYDKFSNRDYKEEDKDRIGTHINKFLKINVF